MLDTAINPQGSGKTNMHEDISPYFTKIFNEMQEVLCYKKDWTFVGTKTISCQVFKHRPNPNYRKRRYKTKCKVSKDILWVIVGAKEESFHAIQQSNSGLSILPLQKYLVPVLHKRRTRI